MRFHFNMGTNLLPVPRSIDDVSYQLATLQDEFIYRGGAEMAVHKALRIIAELDGKGNITATVQQASIPKSPIDVILGLRYYPTEWASLGGGYQVTLHQTDANGLKGKERICGPGRLSAPAEMILPP